MIYMCLSVTVLDEVFAESKKNMEWIAEKLKMPTLTTWPVTEMKTSSYKYFFLTLMSVLI